MKIEKREDGHELKSHNGRKTRGKEEDKAIGKDSGGDKLQPDGERLQRYMARCGVGSRRKCEDLITSGRVLVNGQRPELGCRVSGGDRVVLDGKPISPKRMEYYILNKPAGVICSNVSEGGRTRAVELIPGGAEKGLFTVGRLDVSTTGLIIITNDGDMANRLIHPSMGLEKEYVVRVKGRLSQEHIGNIHRGVDIGDKRLASGKVKNVRREEDRTRFRLVIKEGRFRVIRRMMESLGLEIMALERVRIGSLKLGNIPTGDYRLLTEDFLLSLSETCSQ